MAETSPCPICGTPVRAWERYPNLRCVARTVGGRTALAASLLAVALVAWIVSTDMHR